MSNELVLLGGMCGFAGLLISLICVAMIAGFCRSTHTVQYVPHENSEIFTPEVNLVEENEKALLDKVGKKKKEEPTVVQPLDMALEEIIQTDINY